MGQQMKIVTMTSEDRRWRALVGPYMGRGVYAELGDEITDQPGKVWFIALDVPPRRLARWWSAAIRAVKGLPAGELLGFAGALPGDEVVYQSSYVLPQHRRRRVFDQLFAAREAAYADRPAGGWCSQWSRRTYERYGWSFGESGVEDGHPWWEVTRPRRR